MPTVPPDRVVITFGDLKITAAQFDQFVETMPPQYQAAARGLGRKRFAENVTKVFALAQEGQRRKLNETPEFRARTMFAEANLLAGMTANELSKDIKLDQADVHKYYDDHKAEFEQLRVRHILVRMQGSPLAVKPGQNDLSEAEALARAQELRKKIQDGADFSAIAAAESDDTTTGPRGGDIGIIRHGQTVPSFEEAAFKLKVGELSEPVKSQFGYHLIKVDAISTFDDVRTEVEAKVRPLQVQKAIDRMQEKSKAEFDPDFFAPVKP